MANFPTILNKKNRMVSMLLDHAILCFVAGVFMAPSLLYEMFHLPGN